MGKRTDLEFRRDLKRLVRTGKADVLKVEKLYGRLIAARSDLERGQWLVEIRSILERSGSFGRFLHLLPLFALRSAYRYINGFENCQRGFPATVLREAMEMDLRMYGDPGEPFGRFTAAIKASPPPKNPSPQSARQWLESIIAATPRRIPRRTNPDEVFFELFRVFANRTRWLDLTRREQKAFLVRLVGMILTYWDIDRITITPVSIPESLKPRDETDKARWGRPDVA